MNGVLGHFFVLSIVKAELGQGQPELMRSEDDKNKDYITLGFYKYASCVLIALIAIHVENCIQHSRVVIIGMN